MIKSLYPTFRDRWSSKGSVWIISDTHFDDADCWLMDPDWIGPNEYISRLKKIAHKNDTLIHLGDVGDATYLDELKCYKVLISGNHDVMSKVASHFNEVYDGPLFIADRILLSHEPIFGLEDFCLNIHGHSHQGTAYLYSENLGYCTHVNLASNVCGYTVFDLGKEIKKGLLAHYENYHRGTIDRATTIKRVKEFSKQPILTNSCSLCPNNPLNGGSGVCNCTIGTPVIS